jgi:hypothetical protein
VSLSYSHGGGEDAFGLLTHSCSYYYIFPAVLRSVFVLRCLEAQGSVVRWAHWLPCFAGDLLVPIPLVTLVDFGVLWTPMISYCGFDLHLFVPWDSF